MNSIDIDPAETDPLTILVEDLSKALTAARLTNKIDFKLKVEWNVKIDFVGMHPLEKTDLLGLSDLLTQVTAETFTPLHMGRLFVEHLRSKIDTTDVEGTLSRFDKEYLLDVLRDLSRLNKIEYPSLAVLKDPDVPDDLTEELGSVVSSTDIPYEAEIKPLPDSTKVLTLETDGVLTETGEVDETLEDIEHSAEDILRMFSNTQNG